MLPAGLNHRSFDLGRRPIRAAVRPRRPILQAGIAFSVVTSHPTMRALTRDTHRLSRMRHGPSLPTNPID